MTRTVATGRGSANSAPAHLLPEASDALDLPIDERVAFARRDLWIGYPAATRALGAIEDLLVHPRVARMPCLLLAATSNNGKSTVLRRFRLDHPMVAGPEEKPYLPVVVMDMPETPTEANFWGGLLLGMRIAHRVTAPPAWKKQQALQAMRALHCRMLVVDEVHNLLQSTTPQQRHMLALLKNLSNELMLPIVAAGTADAVVALRTDPQLGSRFEVAALPKWTLSAELLRLLASWEQLLPLREASGLATKGNALALFERAGGTIGAMSRLVKAATVKAIRSGTERITPDLIATAPYAPLQGFVVGDLQK